MEHKVIYKPSFLEDFESILRSIAVKNPNASRKLGLNILRVAESLTLFPERYPRLRRRPQVRRFVIQRHFKVFYRIQSTTRTVEILRCWDGRRGTDPGIL